MTAPNNYSIRERPAWWGAKEKGTKNKWFFFIKQHSLQYEEESTLPVKKHCLEENERNPPKHGNKSEKKVYEEKVQWKVSPEEKERNDKTRKEKYEMKRQRIFQAHWKEVYMYPWVEYDFMNDVMFCKVYEVQ